MPQLHLSRRTGRRLLATGAIAAVAVLGTPAVASAEAPGLPGLDQLPLPLPVPGSDSGAPAVVPAVPGAGGTGGSATPDPAEQIEAGAQCVDGLITGIQVSVTGLADGLGGALAGLLGQSPVPLPGTGEGSAGGVIPTNPEQVAAALDPGAIQDAIADGQDQLTMVVEVVVDGVTELVQVVVDVVECLASLIPTPEAAPPSTQPAPQPAPGTQPAAPVTTQPAAPAQAVAYPGYAPTGGAPSDDSSPAGLIGLGALVAASGGGALWLRARRGVAG